MRLLDNLSLAAKLPIILGTLPLAALLAMGYTSHRVARGMQGFGYRVVPVRPAVSEVLGEKAYPNLSAVPVPVDLVDVFRAPEHVDPIVDECIRLGVKRLWLQDGVVNESAAQRAVAAGITVVMDRCIWRDCMALCAQ